MRPYRRENIPLARELRRNMTPWERKLWYNYLRGYPVRFQRQKAIGEYIVDFYCAQARLAVELDGGGHFEAARIEADRRRTADLEAMGMRVVRFTNAEVSQNFAGVCQMIDMEVQARTGR